MIYKADRRKENLKWEDHGPRIRGKKQAKAAERKRKAEILKADQEREAAEQAAVDRVIALEKERTDKIKDFLNELESL